MICVQVQARQSMWRTLHAAPCVRPSPAGCHLGWRVATVLAPVVFTMSPNSSSWHAASPGQGTLACPGQLFSAPPSLAPAHTAPSTNPHNLPSPEGPWDLGWDDLELLPVVTGSNSFSWSGSSPLSSGLLPAATPFHSGSLVALAGGSDSSHQLLAPGLASSNNAVTCPTGNDAAGECAARDTELPARQLVQRH